MTAYSSNDVPVTDKELDQFWGKEPTQAEINESVGRHAAAFDKDDLMDAIYDQGDAVIAHLGNECPWIAGEVLQIVRKGTIARRASMELYGKPDVIKPSEVMS